MGGRWTVHCGLLVGMLVLLSGQDAHTRELTFEQRVAAQRKIEEVRWRHRIWQKENPQPKPPLSAVLPEAAIRAKVATYLKQSNALEKWWERPITAGQLQA